MHLYDKSFMHIVSDHGLHYTGYSQTELGSLDHKIPFWYTIVPNSILKSCPNQLSNLLQNEGRRISWVDFYQTIIDSHNLGDCTSRTKHKMGVPLHLDPVPQNRRCSEAGVPESLCLLNLPLQNCDSTGSPQGTIIEYLLQQNPEDECIKPKANEIRLEKVQCYANTTEVTRMIISIQVHDRSLQYELHMGTGGKIKSMNPLFAYKGIVESCRGVVKHIETCLCKEGIRQQ